MKGEQLWAQYQFYAQSLTKYCRKLGFAGAAICWIFHTQEMTFPRAIYVSLGLFILYFICDILHYFSASIVLKIFIEREEKKQWEKTGKIDGEIEKPRSVDRLAFIFYCLKIAVLLCAFLVLLYEFARRIRF